jgi:hypothetical protein
MINWKWLGRKFSWPKWATIPAFSWRNWGKSQRTSVTIAVDPTTIWTEHLPDTIFSVTSRPTCSVRNVVRFQLQGIAPGQTIMKMTWKLLIFNVNIKFRLNIFHSFRDYIFRLMAQTQLNTIYILFLHFVQRTCRNGTINWFEILQLFSLNSFCRSYRNFLKIQRPFLEITEISHRCQICSGTEFMAKLLSTKPTAQTDLVSL